MRDGYGRPSEVHERPSRGFARTMHGIERPANRFSRRDCQTLRPTRVYRRCCDLPSRPIGGNAWPRRVHARSSRLPEWPFDGYRRTFDRYRRTFGRYRRTFGRYRRIFGRYRRTCQRHKRISEVRARRHRLFGRLSHPTTRPGYWHSRSSGRFVRRGSGCARTNSVHTRAVECNTRPCRRRTSAEVRLGGGRRIVPLLCCRQRRAPERFSPAANIL